jgi:transcriptional regulator of arginine metabolism
MITKPHRHEMIARLVHERPIQSQHELREALASNRVSVNQATLSRDLQEMGVLKGPNGYMLPPASLATDRGAASLANRLRRELRWIDYSGNTVVLRTDAGHANALAVEIDRSRMDEVLGTIAGDDTIFVLAKRGRPAAGLARTFRDMASLE